MLGMKKAGRRLIIIPPSLAYGSKGVPKRIPANSTLLFETELRRVNPAELFIYLINFLTQNITYFSVSVQDTVMSHTTSLLLAACLEGKMQREAYWDYFVGEVFERQWF